MKHIMIKEFDGKKYMCIDKDSFEEVLCVSCAIRIGLILERIEILKEHYRDRDLVLDSEEDPET